MRKAISVDYKTEKNSKHKKRKTKKKKSFENDNGDTYEMNRHTSS